MTLKVRIWRLITAHWQKACLISETQQNSVRVSFPDKYVMWRLTFVISWLEDSVVQLTFKAGTLGGMTGNLAQSSLGWRRVALDAVGRWCSLLEGVFSVSAQRDIAGLHCQHMPLMLQVSKRNIKGLYPWCSHWFYCCLMFYTNYQSLRIMTAFG